MYNVSDVTTVNSVEWLTAVMHAFSWEDVVENAYALQLKSRSIKVVPPDPAVTSLRQVPVGWTLDHDEHLAQFLSTFVESDNENLGSIKTFVESIEVSTQSVSFCCFSH